MALRSGWGLDSAEHVECALVTDRARGLHGFGCTAFLGCLAESSQKWFDGRGTDLDQRIPCSLAPTSTYVCT